MARQFDVQYLGGYVNGSTACKVEAPKPRKTARKHTGKQSNKRIVLRIDPLAIMGTMVACVMLVLLAVGLVKLMDARQELAAMDAYVQTLRQENVALQEEYNAGYDLEHVKATALALGMVPVEQVQHITIRVQEPEVAPVSGWEQIRLFLVGLFA